VTKKSRINVKKQTKHYPDAQYETYKALNSTTTAIIITITTIIKTS
jgi:hypothetical protein